ncbi:hypothetical protein CIG75_02530 [Tumebacillus algifaecis]|uniref:Uncharacterized protein n=1 Tax=Tumebacillus algifaecis TaxID=1214604 RepID=A0A223CXP4_9BACL|nr:hypothetical protein [Tumebacillus algifaecis]ASS73967.1 hypothetical protein CIG75_02530 [Tumebacillus algifaecis]
MKHSLIIWSIISAVYAAFAMFLGITLRDEMVMLLWLYLMIGIPLLIAYLMLIVLYHTASRKVFWTVFGLFVLIGAGIVGYDLFTVPK